MSRENVEIVRARIEAWNAGDMESVRESSDPGIVVRPPEGWPEPGPFVGREAVMRQFEQLRETWDVDTAERISDFIDVGDRVAMRMRWRTAGHGPEANLEWTVIFTVRKGKVLNVEYFWDHAEALEALGLPKENVDIVRQSLEAWQRDDLDTWLSTLDPAVEWQTALERLVDGVESVYRGVEGMRRFWTVYRTELDDLRFEVQGVRDLGDDRVLLLGHFWWRGPASGIELDSPAGLVLTVRSGKIIRSMDFLSHQEALEAVGLSEQDAHRTSHADSS